LAASAPEVGSNLEDFVESLPPGSQLVEVKLLPKPQK
jgi:hypothetical protein